MAAMIRPSLMVKIDLDERQYDDDIVASIKRSYAHIAASAVSSHAQSGVIPEHTMRLRVKLRQPYWDARDPTSQDTWETVMCHWLENMFYKVSNNIVASNDVYREEGKDEVMYTWLEVQFGNNMVVAMKTRSDASIPDDALDTIEAVRGMAADGAFGDNLVSCVRIPSRASYEAQLYQALAEAYKEYEARRQASESAPESEHDQLADGVIEGNLTTEDPSEVDAPATSSDDVETSDGGDGTLPAETGMPADVLEVTAASGDSSDEAVEPDEAAWSDSAWIDQVGSDVRDRLYALDVDRTVWGIEYADGSVREYDSSTHTFNG
jgi:hypothetical protein